MPKLFGVVPLLRPCTTMLSHVLGIGVLGNVQAQTEGARASALLRFVLAGLLLLLEQLLDVQSGVTLFFSALEGA